MFRSYLAGLAAGVTPFLLIGAGIGLMIAGGDPYLAGGLIGIGATILAITVWIGTEIYRQDLEIRYAPVIEFHVDGKIGHDGNDGLTWQSPFATIRRAVRAAAGVKAPGRGIVIVAPDVGDPSAPLG